MDYFTNKDKVYDHSSMGGWDLGYCDQPHGDTMGFDWAKTWSKIEDQAETALVKGATNLTSSVTGSVEGAISSQLDKWLGGGSNVVPASGSSINYVIQQPGPTTQDRQPAQVQQKKWYENPWYIVGGVSAFLIVVGGIAFAMRKK